MSSLVRSWRTAFLTLRDESLASPPRATVLHLLNHLIFSQSDDLVVAAPHLPSNEVTSDVILLMELAQNLSRSEWIEDLTLPFIHLSQLIYGISHSSSLEMNSNSWALMLDSFKSIVQIFLGEAKTASSSIGNVALIKPTKQCLESLRFLFGLYQAAASLTENEKLLNFILQVVEYIHGENLSDYHTISGAVCETLTIAFSMIGEVYSRVGSSLPVETKMSTIEVLRKVMDILVCKRLLLEDNNFAMFYYEILHCMHLVLTELKGYQADHVAGFIATLRLFFRYGLVNKPQVLSQETNLKKEVGSTSQSFLYEVSNRPRSGPYRPPLLRNKSVRNQLRRDEDRLVSPRNEFISSDSDCSDNDGSVMDDNSVHFAKARLAAIVCIQDLCRADPKLFTSQWTLLLPSNDVLQHRKYDATLMSCLLFDPSLKVRIVAASTIMTMLDGQASISLQVAEYREHSKCGSFTTLSSSLGHMLMQLHLGTLYLIKHETNNRLLVLAFEVLVLLLSSTPYSRMSPELLSSVISSVQSKIEEGFPSYNDRNNLLATSINCLSIALSIPASMHVNNMLLGEISTGSLERQRSGVMFSLFRLSEQLSNPSTSLEAFQALKAVAHNYPCVMGLCWEQVSSIIYKVLSSFSDMYVGLWRGCGELSAASIKERVITAAVKVLDECLRAISGFKGTEDLPNDKSLDSPFTSDFVKTKAVSSAPSYSLESPASTIDESKACMLASERWSEATIKHMPNIIGHSSAMVRAASVTCFAGMTSSVFFSLPKDKQEYIISSSINAALNDEVPSVRAAACRAIGVIACFPQIYHSTEVLERFIHAAERNSHDSLVSVRITASWALANICDSLSHFLDTLHAGRGSIESRKSSEFISLLVYNALRLARDNDKVKANAVRGLGYLSRSIQCTVNLPVPGDTVDYIASKIQYYDAQGSKDHNKEKLHSLEASSGSSDWLGQMVQTFLSCVATGNVKVQWNVCHALSNLFLNKTLKLQDMDWASSVFSILLLLLRDSSNFKIRIQAAAALAVPETIKDYGKSFFDVVRSVEHVVENFKTDQISKPSDFKYWVSLEKQLTSTMLHLLGLASTCDQRLIQDFLIKKASFLEIWMKELCSGLGDPNKSGGETLQVCVDQKKDVICRTTQSLIKVYERSNHHPIAQRFERLVRVLV